MTAIIFCRYVVIIQSGGDDRKTVILLSWLRRQKNQYFLSVRVYFSVGLTPTGNFIPCRYTYFPCRHLLTEEKILDLATHNFPVDAHRQEK